MSGRKLTGGSSGTKKKSSSSTKKHKDVDIARPSTLKTRAVLDTASLDAFPSDKVGFSWVGLEDRVEGERGMYASPPPHPQETSQRREVSPPPWLLWSRDKVEKGSLTLNPLSLESHSGVANEGQEAETAISEALALAPSPMDEQVEPKDKDRSTLDKDRVRKRLHMEEATMEPSTSSSKSSEESHHRSPSGKHRYTLERPHSVQEELVPALINTASTTNV